MNSQVDYILPQTILELTSKNSSFNSGIFAVNNNKNVSIMMHTSSPSSLNCTAKIQGSNDNSTWVDIASTSVTVTGVDNVLWTMSELHGLIYLRVSVTMNSGSSLFLIEARGT